jgi:hypothetical protein
LAYFVYYCCFYFCPVQPSNSDFGIFTHCVGSLKACSHTETDLKFLPNNIPQ